MACTVSEDTRVDVAKFSSAPSTLWLYLATSMRAQDHPHPIAGRALPPLRWRRIASRKCEEPFRGEVNIISSGSTLRGRFSGYSLVRLRQMAVVALLHCKLTNWLVVKICTMKTNNEARSILLGPLVPLGRHGELIVAGQVAMATGRDGRRTMPTVGAGSPIDGRPSGTRMEDTTGAWTVRPLHGAPPGIGEQSEGRTNGAQMSSLTTVQSTA